MADALPRGLCYAAQIQLEQLQEFKSKWVTQVADLKNQLKHAQDELAERKASAGDETGPLQEVAVLARDGAGAHLLQALEMATLDKEMAEERVGQLESQVAEMKDQLEGKQLAPSLVCSLHPQRPASSWRSCAANRRAAATTRTQRPPSSTSSWK